MRLLLPGVLPARRGGPDDPGTLAGVASGADPAWEIHRAAVSAWLRSGAPEAGSVTALITEASWHTRRHVYRLLRRRRLAVLADGLIDAVWDRFGDVEAPPGRRAGTGGLQPLREIAPSARVCPPAGHPCRRLRSGCTLSGDLRQPKVIITKPAMTFRTESRLKIASSVDEVWAYICDVGRWPEWAPTVLECRVRGGGPLQPGSRVEQRAKLILGMSRSRSQEVTAVEAPNRVAFAGPLGNSRARWGMELDPVDDNHTDAMMWIEVDLAGIMRVFPGPARQASIQRVSDGEMVAMKAAIESTARGGAGS